jgi:predicted DCC family thiol-disulfide oxidoreductase YuxK
MTTEVRSAEKFLAYDGDCPMCIATVGAIVRWGLIRQEQARPNYELDVADAELARAAGIRNQLVVIDPATRQTRVGSDALLWIIGETPRFRPLVRLLSLPGLRHLLSYGYQAISYNRRIVSPPKHQIVCDCEPQVTVARRLTLIVPLVLMSMVIAAGFGAAAFVGCQLGPAVDGAFMLLAATTAGWALMGLAGTLALGGMRAIDHLGHLAVTMFAGALILLPGTVAAAWLPRPMAAAVVVLSLMYCFSTMFKMQLRRVKAQQLSVAWAWGWAGAMLSTFAVALAFWFRDLLS